MDDRKIVLIATIGTRDVTFDGCTFNKVPVDSLDEDMKKYFGESGSEKKTVNLLPRKGGKYFVENLDKYIKRLECPIIGPVVQEIFKREKSRIEKVFLVATDQKKIENDWHWKNDTLYFAQIIKEKLKRKNKSLDRNKKFLEQADSEIILVKENVVKLDFMKSFWEERFKNKALTNFNNQNTKLYVCPVGGIDAINTSLLITCIKRFGERCTHIYMSEEDKVPVVSGIVADLLWDIDKEKLKHFLNRFDYASVLDTLKTRTHYANYLKLVEIAKNRLYFNLDDALEICNEIIEKHIPDNKVRQEAEDMRSELIKINNSPLARIIELYYNARIKYAQEQYVDFLLRMFRVEESINRYLIEKYMGIYTGKDKKERFKKFTWDIEKNSYLVQYLENYKIEGNNPLIWKNNPNNEVFRAILRFVVDVNKNSEGDRFIGDQQSFCKIDRALKLSDKLKTLSQLRNNSIAAHGFEGVSRERINNMLKEKAEVEIEEAFNAIEKFLGVSFDKNPYMRLNKLLLRSIGN